MKSDRGMALITALLILTFLTILGGALLTNAALDTKISDNYRTNTNLHFLTEAALEAGRESIRASVQSATVSSILTTGAGADGTLSSATDRTTLLASDDVALASNVTLTDTDGQTVGQYYVYLRNDAADGRTSTGDTNDVLDLLAIGVIGDSEKVIELTVKKGSFPTLPAALTLNGDIGNNDFSDPNSNGWEAQGDDEASSGASDVNAIGVVSSSSSTEVSTSLSRPNRVCGSGTNVPPATCSGPDVVDVSSLLSSQLTTPAGLLEIVAEMESVATSTTCPGNNAVGSAASPAVIVVQGDCSMAGGATRYGLLVVRGALTFSGGGTWNGLIVVIDDSNCTGSHDNLTQSGTVSINGGMFIANTYLGGGAPGPLGDICVNFNGGGNGGIYYNSELIRNSVSGLPFAPIAYREY